MGLVNQLLASDNARPSPTDDFWYKSFTGMMTAAGIRVNSDSALRIAAVYACVKILSETVAMLPLNMNKYLPDGKGSEVVPKHPLQTLLHDQSNPWQTAFEFREMMQAHVCLRGNAYARIVGSSRRPVDMLIPLHPDRMVKVEQLPSFRVRYTYRDGKGNQHKIVTGKQT